MRLKFTKPDPRLLRELQAVAEHADELRRALEIEDIEFPDDFPFREIEGLIKRLTGLPEGTAEGCREILGYARVRFADIGQRFIGHDDKVGTETDKLETSPGLGHNQPPSLTRGREVDRAIGFLLKSVSYAQAEYSRQSGDAIEDDSDTETGVRPGTDLEEDIRDLRVELQLVEGKTGQLRKKIKETTLPNSERADQLCRQVRDAGGHAGVALNELELPAPKPGQLERINRILQQLPDVIEKTGYAMQIGIDIAKPFVDQWLNQLSTDIFNLVIKHLRVASGNIEKAGQRLKAERAPPTRTIGRPPFTIFRDIGEPWCPQLVMLPAGTFIMGAPENEEGRDDWDMPQHEVTISQPFSIGVYAVTFDEYDHFCDETGFEKPEDQRWGRGRRPVILVSHEQAEAYCAWLSEATDATYGLPTEAMWEYACRAGTTTPFSYGDYITTDEANYFGTYPYADGEKGEFRGKTVPVGSLRANPWGLFDMHGNVWEWCADGRREYMTEAVTNPQGPLDSSTRVLRGGAWGNGAQGLRSARRNADGPGRLVNDVGFRCVRI